MKISELASALLAVETKLDLVGGQLAKAQTEIINAIDTLKAQLADADIPEAAVTTLDNLGAKAAGLSAVSQALDDLNPDKP